MKQERAEIVKSGRWLYGGSVEYEVWIVRQNFEYWYEEEYDDEERLNEDGEVFAVVYARTAKWWDREVRSSVWKKRSTRLNEPSPAGFNGRITGLSRSTADEGISWAARLTLDRITLRLYYIARRYRGEPG